jgi:PTH1 family peptidyl-tRNA hydrolase
MIRRALASIRRNPEEVRASETRLLVGLGNVGAKYVRTRHNLGFEVVDELAGRWDATNPRSRFDARLQEVTSDDARVVLAAPTTMMNNSGFAVAQLANWYKLSPTDILIIYDELDLPFGTLKLRSSGGAGGHNGVRSVISQLGTQEFHRLRIGVGRPTSGSTIGFLLSRFSVAEQQALPDLIALSADAAESWTRDGLERAMNEFNRRSIDLPGEFARSGVESGES